MTQPNKLSRTTLINGACLVLVIVGLALVTNKLLDEFAIADEAGLTIAQRKEKAQRNDVAYHQTPPSHEFTLASWFSSNKYDCENKEVIEEVKNQLACTKLFTCSAFGFQSLAEVVATDRKELRRILDDWRDRAVKDGIRRMKDPTSNDLKFNELIVTKLADVQWAMLASFAELYSDVRVITDDFNPPISKYTCRMQFRYPSFIVRPFWGFYYRNQFLKDSNTVFVAGEQLKTNPNADYISWMTETAIRANGYWEKADRPQQPISTAQFTVSPSREGGFVVDITDVPLPGGH